MALVTLLLIGWGGAQVVWSGAGGGWWDLVRVVGWLGLVGMPVLLFYFWVQHIRAVRRWASAMRCHSCGYSLRGLVDADIRTCPECGAAILGRVRFHYEAEKLGQAGGKDPREDDA